MPDQKILMGVVGRAHGTRGLVRVHSYTAVPADLAGYAPLTDETGRQFRLAWAGDGVAEIFLLANGVAEKPLDRTAAEKLTNTRLYAPREILPPPDDDDEFYFSDLVGLAAFGPDGALGKIVAVHDYGAGVSLEIVETKERPALLVPFTRACVPHVNIAAGRVEVIPPAEVVTEREAAE